MHLCQLGPLGEGNEVLAKSCIPEAAEGSPGTLPTTAPQMREVGGDQQKQYVGVRAGKAGAWQPWVGPQPQLQGTPGQATPLFEPSFSSQKRTK